MAISAQFTADFTQWSAAVAQAKGDVESLQTATDNFAPKVEQQAAIAAGALKTFGKEIVGVAGQFLKSYGEEEEATRGLVAALEAQGSATDGVIADYSRMATEFQKTSTFADEAVTRSQAIFTAIGRVGPENMQAAMEAAANLATYMKTDITTAANMMAKAIGSGGESLGSLKKILGDAAPEGKEFADIVGAINGQFGGQYAAQMDTTNGKLASLKNQFGDVADKAGELLAKGLTPILNAFLSLPEPVQQVLATVGVIGAALLPVAAAFASVVTAVTPLLALIGGAGGLVAILGTLLPILGLVAAAVTAGYLVWKNWDKIKEIVMAVYNTVKEYLVDKFNAIVGQVTGLIEKVTGAWKWMADKVALHSYVPDMINTVADQFGRLPSVMTEPAVKATEATTAAFAAMQAKLDDQARAWVDSPFNKMAGSIFNVLTDSGGVAKDPYGNPVAIGGELGAANKSMGQQNISVVINGSVLSTADQLAMRFQDAAGRAFTQGGNRWPGF